MPEEGHPAQIPPESPAPEEPTPGNPPVTVGSEGPALTPESSASLGSDPSTRAEFLWKVHGYTNEYIRFADAKAGFVVGFASALLWALFAGKCHEMFITIAPRQWTGLAWVSLASYLLLVASILASITAVRPRLWAGSSKGLIFWQSVVRYGDPDAYVNALLAVPPEELPDHIARHVFVLARVSCRKYAWVNGAILTVTLGGLLGIAVLLLKP